MKFCVIIFCLLIYNTSIAQNKIEPDLENYSKADIKLIEPLIPGKKILFKQDCLKGYKETLPNGIVRFRNLRVINDFVNALIEFKDTIVNKVVFSFYLRDKDAMQYFKIAINQFVEINKKEAYQSYICGNIEYICLLKQKKITLILTCYKESDN